MNVPRFPSAEEAVNWAVSMESAGIDVLWIGEAYGFDAVSMLGLLAGRTSRVQLGSAILPVFSRSPALTAMTAAGLDFVSSGRFILGLGSVWSPSGSGLARRRLRSPTAAHQGDDRCMQTGVGRARSCSTKEKTIELPGGDGRSLKLLNQPVRPDIPIYIAALGAKNVALAAEVAQGWLPIFFHPDRHDVWASSLTEGASRRDPALGPLEIVAGGPVSVCDEGEADRLRDAERPHVALYVGGMGSVGQNFYNDLFVKYGYEQQAHGIQELYLSGKRQEAEALVPADYLKSTLLVGDEEHVRGQD